MSLTASTYNKIQSIKAWATAKLPTVTEESYASLLTDLLNYLDSLIKNNDFFETDIKAIIIELNKLINSNFPTVESMQSAISNINSQLNQVPTTIENKLKVHTDKVKKDITDALTNVSQEK